MTIRSRTNHGRPALNLKGKRYGKLFVLKQLPSKNGSGYSLVRCDCGIKKPVLSANLERKNGTRSCGCVHRERETLPPDILRRRIKLSSYKSRAKRRGIHWAISDDLFDELIRSCCHWCGRPSLTKFFNGVDRLYSDQGYEEGNVVPCCGICNLMKRVLTPYQFLEHIRRIYAYQEEIEKIQNRQPS